MDITKKVLEKKEEINYLKNQQVIVTGKLEQLLEQIKQEFKVGTIEEAKKIADKWEKEINILEKEIQEYL